MLLSPGFLLLNRYQILRALHPGGMAEIYLALDRNLNTRVAVKESFSTDPVANAQFQQEAQFLANLLHPNLPRVTDFFTEPNGARYLVMDFVEGENLQDIVHKRGRLTPDQMLAWFKTIFNAVNYLHTQPQPIIHRDINPRNIIIRPDGKAMLVDFGIAKVLTGGTTTTHGLTGYGTPGYAPPEQYSGGTDERTDVYALGATMYFALTGETPPDAPMRAAGTILTPPSQFNPLITPRIERAILTAMNLNAAQRFHSVAELSQSIYAAITQPLTRTATVPPIAAQGPVTAPLPAPRAEFMPIILGSLVGGILLAALILGGLYVGGFFGGTTATPTFVSNITHTPTATETPGAQPTAVPRTIFPPQTTPPLVTPIVEPSDTATRFATSTFTPSDTVTTAPTDMPTDTPIPFAILNVQANVFPERSSECPVTFVFQATVRASAAGITRYRWEFSNGSVDAIHSFEFGEPAALDISAAQWKFEGGQEIHFSGWGQLRVLEPVEMLSNQAQFRVDCTAPPTDTPTPTPRPPQARIAFSSERSGNSEIYVMDQDGGNLTRLTNHPAKDDDPVPSPDGAWIVFTSFRDSNGDRGELYRMRPDGSGLQRLTSGGGNYGASWSPDGRQIVFYSLRDGGKRNYVMNADGSNQHRISTGDCAGQPDDWEPVWSPNGAWIAYESIPHRACEGGGTADIFISSPDGSNRQNLTRSAGIDDETPNWSPDGRIVFSSYRNGNADLYVMNADGSNVQQLTGMAGDDLYPAWSPDGRFIVFQSGHDDNQDIYIMNDNGSNLRRLTFDGAENEYPNWLP